MGKEANIFKRYEVKYLLTEEQYEELRERTKEHLIEDSYGETTICNCYFDTPDYRLIRTSLEKPVYKEKLRLRSYGTPEQPDKQVFLELKKKYRGIVYKRRECMNYQEAEEYVLQGVKPEQDTQILREIDWAMHYYGRLIPAMNLSYQRIAMYEKQPEGAAEVTEQCGTHTGNLDLRITFDRNILWRTEHLRLKDGVYGNELLEPGQRIMEVKTPGAIPRWFADILDEMKLYPVSFSKYGRAYQAWMMREQNGRIA